MSAALPRALTVTEVAERFRMSRAWVYAHAGELGAIKCGAALRFPLDRIHRYERDHAIPIPEIASIDERRLLQQAAREV
jgi:excisionase family DNA binding protein